MKKLAKFLGVLLVLLISAALIIPLVVDVDKYRPQIVEVANKKINGSLELGKLSLSLWGQIRIEVGGVKLRDSKGSEVVSVDQAYFHLPLSSVISGAPLLTLKMEQPVVNVVKNREGKLNLMTLAKIMPPAAGTPASPATGTATTSVPSGSVTKSEPTVLPAIVSQARLGIELSHALVNYQDELSGLKSDVKDLNLVLKDISLSHATEIEVWAELDTRMGNVFTLRGPARFKGLATPEFVGSDKPQLKLDAKLDLDAVAISAPGLFEKKAGLAANVELKLVGSEAQVKVEELKIRFFNAEIKADGTVYQPSATPVLGLTVKTNEIQLKPWLELVPLLADYELDGSAQLDFNVKGSMAQPNYRAKLVLNSLSAKLPKLKTNPKFDGVINISTDQVESILMTMKAPGNELKIQGRVASFSRPRVDLFATSTGMDLDQFIEFPPMGRKVTGASGEKQPVVEGADNSSGPVSGNSPGNPREKAKSPPASDYDSLLSPLRENKILAATEFNLALDMKSMKAYAIKMSEIGCNLNYKNRVADFKGCGLKVFSGAVKATLKMNFNSKVPTYSFTSQVSDLDMSQAIESQMALFKNTLTGKANMAFRGQGSSLNPDAAMAGLNGSGNMRVEQAVFATIDVMRMVKEGVNESLGKLANTIPALKGKMITSLPGYASKYQVVSSDFSIAGLKFHAPNLVAQAVPNQGIDIKGSTTVGIQDYRLNTVWEVIDTYNLMHLRDISIDEAGVQVPHLLAEGNAPVHFTVHADCTIMAPCYSYTEVPAYLSKVALTNIGNAMAGRAKDEVRKKAETMIDKVVPKDLSPEIKDKLKGLFH